MEMWDNYSMTRVREQRAEAAQLQEKSEESFFLFILPSLQIMSQSRTRTQLCSQVA